MLLQNKMRLKYIKYRWDGIVIVKVIKKLQKVGNNLHKEVKVSKICLKCKNVPTNFLMSITSWQKLQKVGKKMPNFPNIGKRCKSYKKFKKGSKAVEINNKYNPCGQYWENILKSNMKIYQNIAPLCELLKKFQMKD